jgi:hypothetical protein
MAWVWYDAAATAEAIILSYKEIKISRGKFQERMSAQTPGEDGIGGDAPGGGSDPNWDKWWQLAWAGDVTATRLRCNNLSLLPLLSPLSDTNDTPSSPTPTSSNAHS